MMNWFERNRGKCWEAAFFFLAMVLLEFACMIKGRL